MSRVMDAKEAAEVCRDMAEECALHDDVMDDDEPRVRRMKWAMAHLLTEGERRVLYLYAETMSLRKVARVLGVSHMTIKSDLRRIRIRIVDFVENGKEV